MRLRQLGSHRQQAGTTQLANQSERPSGRQLPTFSRNEMPTSPDTSREHGSAKGEKAQIEGTPSG